MVKVKMEILTRWCLQDEVNREEIEQNEVDEMKKGADGAYLRQRLVIYNEDDTDGRARVTTDK